MFRHTAEYRKASERNFCLTGHPELAEQPCLPSLPKFARPGQHHRQAVLDQFAKIIPTVLKEEAPRLRADGGIMPRREFS